MLSIEFRLGNHNTTLFEVRRGTTPLLVINLYDITYKRLHQLHLLTIYHNTQDIVLLQLGLARSDTLLVLVVKDTSHNEVAARHTSNLGNGLTEDCVVGYAHIYSHSTRSVGTGCLGSLTIYLDAEYPTDKQHRDNDTHNTKRICHSISTCHIFCCYISYNALRSTQARSIRNGTRQDTDHSRQVFARLNVKVVADGIYTVAGKAAKQDNQHRQHI